MTAALSHVKNPITCTNAMTSVLSFSF